MRRVAIITSLLTIILFVGCKPPRADKPATLSVTINPQKYFLDKIVGDKYSVNCVVPSGSNPESFDLAPSQLMILDKSIAYFKVGYLGIENTLIEKISHNNPDMKLIDCSIGITPIEGSHIHEHADGEHHDHGHDGADPHIWSSPATAKIIADNMFRAVVDLDKANEDFYTTNYNELIAGINETDSILRTYIDKAPSKAFIIYHPALSYFAEEYGLTQYTIEYEGKNPSPSQLKQLIDTAKAEGVKVVFIQQEFDTKNAETVANAIGAKTVPINLLSYYWKEEMIKIAKALASDNE
ncbi:metal ABC transporter solute-binding protein, Zn/Mn family [Dysgonomonas sp. ZJ279]|uniref:metal ABC transporter solute-binding protein, Zn/Mn family n=1 Tax=Dysgonomonas sp. ZJ279 TaxID=2709796 RepID=UPI0013EB48DC|nr:zinc ABC transporter substrate-binding protein [Dysgonomonas sp. ZJ279]